MLIGNVSFWPGVVGRLILHRQRADAQDDGLAPLIGNSATTDAVLPSTSPRSAAWARDSSPPRARYDSLM